MKRNPPMPRPLLAFSAALLLAGLASVLLWLESRPDRNNEAAPVDIAWQRSGEAGWPWRLEAVPGGLRIRTDGAVYGECRTVHTTATMKDRHLHISSEEGPAGEVACGWPPKERWRIGEVALPAGAYRVTWTLRGQVILDGAIGVSGLVP
jgi:hypothetical protein